MVIRFLRGWQGHGRGEINSTLGRGIQLTLLQYGYAEAMPDPPALKPKRRRKSAARSR